MASIHIAREGELLGSFTDEQVLEGIRSGSFKPSDHVWMEGMEDWVSLDEMARHWGVELPSQKTQAAPVAPVTKPSPAPATPKARTPAPAPAAQARAAAPSKKPAPATAVESTPVEAAPVLAISAEEGMTPAWEQRRTRGFFPALFGTIKGVLLQPGVTFTAMKRTGGLGGPLSFYVILVWVSALATAAANFFLKASMLSSISKLGVLPRGVMGGTKQAMASGAMEIGILLMVMLGTVIVMVLSLFLASGIVHLLLKLLGGAKQPYETTFRVFCYSESTAILKLIPGLGFIIALPWSLCCQIIGLKNAHGTQAWRAVLAVFLPFIFCCCSIVSPLAFVLGKSLFGTKPAVKQASPAKPSAQKPTQKAGAQKKPSPTPKAKH